VRSATIGPNILPFGATIRSTG